MTTATTRGAAAIDEARWPLPVGEPVLVLLDTSTGVERRAIERWMRTACPPGSDVEQFLLPEAPHETPALRALEAGLAAEDDPWLLPLRVVWLPEEHDGERSVRLRDVLLSFDNPRRPRSRHQGRIVRSHPERCRVVVAEPARLSELRRRCGDVCGEDDSPRTFTQFVARQAVLALERAESRLVGAEYKVPRLVREELTSSFRFRDGLAKLAKELGRTEDEVVEEANSYLEEMVTGWSRLLIDLGVRLGRYNFKRGYDPELDYDPQQVARLKDAAERYPLVFLPGHKSNLDTLVLNVALHDNGLPRTHIFGGNNMAFWPIGPIFRHAGTAYIRRSIKGNPVYIYALREYIGYLIGKRFSLQFYMEGGRSRTGKLLPPKTGLLAYVADAYRQGRSDDVVLVPVSITYDQLQEVGEFAREARGGNKSAESIGWLVRAFREQRGRFGKIYVRFAEPLSLRDCLGLPEGEGGDEEAQRLALQKVALEVSRRINEVTPITATSLVTLSLLGAQGRALTLDQIRATVHDPLDYATRRGLPLAQRTDLETNEGVLSALRELERHNVVSRYEGGAEPVFVIGSDQHLAAAFYRNSMIHFFLPGAIAQVALARAGAEDLEDPLGTFWNAVFAARDLLKFEFPFQSSHGFRAVVEAELAVQDPHWDEKVEKGPDGIRALLEGFHPLVAHTVLRSFIEAYGVVAAALVRHQADGVEDKEFLASCLALGRQFLLQQRIRSAESLAKPLFANALKLASSRGLVGPGADTDGRAQLLGELRGVIRDLDVIEALATARVVSLINAEPAGAS